MVAKGRKLDRSFKRAHNPPMGRFQMDADGEAVTMSPQQIEAVTTFGSENGGTIEVHAAENGALLVFAENGQVVVVQRDGSAAQVR